MEKDEERITLRIPSSLHAELTESAKRERRSLNGQIITLLEKAMEEQKVKVSEPSGN